MGTSKTNVNVDFVPPKLRPKIKTPPTCRPPPPVDICSNGSSKVGPWGPELRTVPAAREDACHAEAGSRYSYPCAGEAANAIATGCGIVEWIARLHPDRLAVFPTYIVVR